MVGKRMNWKQTAVAAAALTTALGWTAAAQAFDVPPFRGNDTGGIIAYEYAMTIDVHELAVSHCEQYDKAAQFTGADKRYGGYISFTCVWVRPASISKPIRTLY